MLPTTEPSSLESRLTEVKNLLAASQAELQPDGRWFAPDRESFFDPKVDPPRRFVAWFDGSCWGTTLTIVRPARGGGVSVSKFEVEGSKNLREIGEALSD